MIIDDYVKERGITYQKLSELIGVSRDTIYNWRKGIRKPGRFAAIQVEKITKKKITAKSLRPDLFP